jgi:hypothetical protein
MGADFPDEVCYNVSSMREKRSTNGFGYSWSRKMERKQKFSELLNTSRKITEVCVGGLRRVMLALKRFLK